VVGVLQKDELVSGPGVRIYHLEVVRVSHNLRMAGQTDARNKEQWEDMFLDLFKGVSLQAI
jgi:hypothetical protein